MQLAITGRVIGSITAITAIGLSMICKTLNFVTFAHGDFVAFAAYIALLQTLPACSSHPIFWSRYLQPSCPGFSWRM